MDGFHQGYSYAADAKELLAGNKIASPQRVFLEEADRDVLGIGRNKQ